MDEEISTVAILESEFDADSPPAEGLVASLTRRKVKQAVQELIRYGFLEAAVKPNLYQSISLNMLRVVEILEPLDLSVKLDEIRGLCILELSADVEEIDEAWAHPMVRKQRLTLEQSLLLAILRQYYIIHEQEYGISVELAAIDLEELQAEILLYLGESGSDSKDEKRVRNLLESLKPYSVVSEVSDKSQFVIRPLITHFPSLVSLDELLQHFKSLAVVDNK